MDQPSQELQFSSDPVVLPSFPASSSSLLRRKDLRDEETRQSVLFSSLISGNNVMPDRGICNHFWLTLNKNQQQKST